MATISSVVYPSSAPFMGSAATINGSGFGAARGASKVFIGPNSSGEMVEVASYTSWSATAILVVLPSSGFTVGGNAFLFVALENTTIGARSLQAAFIANPTLRTEFAVGEMVLGAPNTYPLGPGGTTPRGFVTAHPGTYTVDFYVGGDDPFESVAGIPASGLSLVQEPLLTYFAKHDVLPES